MLVLAFAAGCSSQLYLDACEGARDHLIDLRFAAVGHDAAALWQLLVEHGGADNVDRRALLAAAARSHDDRWLDPLRDRQRFSRKMRAWVNDCADRPSIAYAACVANARSLDEAARCDD